MKRQHIIILIALSLALAGLLAYQQKKPSDKSETAISGFANSVEEKKLSVTIDAQKFLVPERFDSAWSAPPQTTACKKYRAAITNHHALASDLIADLIREIARCRPEIKTMIILSPDHYSAGSGPITIGHTNYQIAGEIVKIDTEATDRLKRAIPSAGESEMLFEHEHGIGALVPFIHRIFPDVTIVPIAVKASMGTTERERLTVWLTSESARGVFILVSSDMSHYLDGATATKNDERTKRALADSDKQFFASAKDSFTDSGPAISITMKSLGEEHWHLLNQSISSHYAGSNAFTTTYITGLWD